MTETKLEIGPPLVSPFAAHPIASSLAHPSSEPRRTSRFRAPDDDSDDENQVESGLDSHGSFLSSWSSPSKPAAAQQQQQGSNLRTSSISTTATASTSPRFALERTSVPGDDSTSAIMFSAVRESNLIASEETEETRKKLEAETRKIRTNSSNQLTIALERSIAELRASFSFDSSREYKDSVEKIKVLVERECRRDNSLIDDCRTQIREILSGKASASTPNGERPRSMHHHHHHHKHHQKEETAEEVEQNPAISTATVSTASKENNAGEGRTGNVFTVVSAAVLPPNALQQQQQQGLTMHGMRPKSAPSTSVITTNHQPLMQINQQGNQGTGNSQDSGVFKTPTIPLQRRNSGISAAALATAAELQKAAESVVFQTSSSQNRSNNDSIPSVSTVAKQPPPIQNQSQDQQRVIKTAPFLAPTPPVPPSPFSLSPCSSPTHTPASLSTTIGSLSTTTIITTPLQRPIAIQPNQQTQNSGFNLPIESPSLHILPDAPPINPMPTPEISPSPVEGGKEVVSPTPSPSRVIPPSPFTIHHGKPPTISGIHFQPPQQAQTQQQQQNKTQISQQQNQQTNQQQIVMQSPFSLSVPNEPKVGPLPTPTGTPSGSPFSLSRPSVPPTVSGARNLNFSSLTSYQQQQQQNSQTLPSPNTPLITPGPQQQQSLSARDERTGPSPSQGTNQFPPKPPVLGPAPTPPVPASPFGLLGSNDPTQQQSLSGHLNFTSPPVCTPATNQNTTNQNSLNALLENAEGSIAALNDAKHSFAVLKRVAEVEASHSIDEKTRIEYKKRIRLAVNQISADEQQVSRKIEDLSKVLIETKTISIGLYNWSLRELACGIVAQADDQVAQCQGSAFCIAAVAVGIASRFNDFSEILVAQFHEDCIYTVPCHLNKLPTQTKDQFLLSLGYKMEANGIEGFESYAKRVSGIVSLYGAFMQTRMPSYGGRQNTHPRGIEHAWEWIARVLNMKPIAMGPTIILCVLETAGSDLHNHYGKQFMKILRSILVYLDNVKPTVNIEASIARLKRFIGEALEKGFVSSHPEAKVFLR